MDFLLTLRTLKSSIPKFIQSRKDEIQSLYDQGILPTDSYERQWHNLENIESCLAREVEYLEEVVQTYKDIRKKVSAEREEIKRAEQAKESVAVAYKRGYINASDYRQKIQDIDAKKDS